jgi:hypothetical protein
MTAPMTRQIPSFQPDTRARFWSHVDKSGGCWLWTSAILSNGYGRVTIGRIGLLAHRVAYEFEMGPIPDGLTIDHLCRVRHCVNPAHLEAVTNGENIRRGFSPLALRARQTHCLRGHPFDEQNTYWTRDGLGRMGRHCRRCTYERNKRNKARRRAEARNAA